jgi:hypothetical protein
MTRKVAKGAQGWSEKPSGHLRGLRDTQGRLNALEAKTRVSVSLANELEKLWGGCCQQDQGKAAKQERVQGKNQIIVVCKMLAKQPFWGVGTSAAQIAN